MGRHCSNCACDETSGSSGTGATFWQQRVADAKDISARATANAATTLIPVAVPTSVGATSSLELETSTQCHCKVPEA